MRKHFQVQLLTAAALLLAFVGFLGYASPVREAVGEALSLSARVLIPSLFPAMVLCSLFIETGLAQDCGRQLEPVMRLLFDLPGESAAPLLLGLSAGYPIGAKSTLSLYHAGALTRAEAQRLLAFVNNSGPAFLLGAVGFSLFSSRKAGWILFASHLFSAFSLGFLTRLCPHAPTRRTRGRAPAPPRPSFSAAFTSSVGSCALALINVTAFVVFFSAVNRVLAECGILTRLAALLSYPTGLSLQEAEGLLVGMIEMTGGLAKIASGDGALPHKLILSAFLLGWAGLSVHCQALSFAGEKKLSFAPYFAGKFLHGLLSAFFAFLLTRLFPFAAPASLTAALPAAPAFSPAVLTLFCSALSGLIPIIFSAAQKKL